MGYKLIISDIDSTLLNQHNTLLPSTAETINRLTEVGMLFATASARTRTNIVNAVSAILDNCCAHAYLSDAFIETNKGIILYDSPMEHIKVLPLVKKCNELEASVCCISFDGAIAHILHPECDLAFRLIHKHLALDHWPVSAKLKTYLVVVYAPSVGPIVEMINNEIPELEASPVSSIQRHNSEFVFIQNKGHALKLISDYFEIGLSDTIAFGDSISNDGAMIETTGYGVAMKNGSKPLHMLADEITDKDYNEDGLGGYFRKMIKESSSK